MKLPVFIFLLCTGLVLNCQAQNSELSRKSQNGVIYVSGGIAQDQQQVLQSRRDDFNLQLTFAAKGSGEYLVDVMVNIDSAAGLHFVNALSDGPLFLAKLAPGEYSVNVRHGDSEQVKNVTIGTSGIRELYFYW